MLFCFVLLSAGLLAAPGTPEKTPEKMAKVSAFDKPTMEAYVRHLNVWGPQIKVEVEDPKPSELPGFDKVTVHASAGKASADFTYYVSKDGQKVVQGNVYDIAHNPFKPELDKLKTDRQPSFGTPGAPVVLVEFSDFECPMCREEAKMLRDNLVKTYPTQVRFYFMTFPLETIHPWARAAAIAGHCIFRQNASLFWDYHDWIFAHQEEITPANLKDKIMQFVQGKKIDSLQLGRCMDNNETAADVDRTEAIGKAVDVGATPTLFVNGRRIVGRMDWNTLREVIDYEIDYQKVAHNAGENCCEVTLPAPSLHQTTKLR